MTRTLRRLVVALMVVVVAVTIAGPASAHPLGNFTTNTSAALLAGPDRLDVIYVLDLAEVPTRQARREIDTVGGSAPWARQQCAEIADAQRIAVNGAPATLSPGGVGVAFPPGDAGLDTLRLRCVASTPLPDERGEVEITLTDGFAGDRIGWREVVATGDGVAVLTSNVPQESASAQLRQYPEAEVSSVTSARLVVDTSASGDTTAAAVLRDGETQLATVEEGPGGLEGLVQSYTDLVARQDLTVGFVLLAILLAIGLGTAHAVAPGHGKTVIAAYLLGEEGNARQAVALGGTVAVTHTIGVLVLGVIVQASTAFAPERLYPVLGLMGGVLFALVGVTLLYRAITSRGHTHDHAHGHSHDHDHSHDDGHDHGPARTGWRMLVLPGLAGGMVPSPSALLVLLGGIAIGRTWLGVLLVIAYGVGMALALVGAGYLLQRVRYRVAERLESATWARVSGALPVVTSSLIIVGGVVIAARSLIVA